MIIGGLSVFSFRSLGFFIFFFVGGGDSDRGFILFLIFRETFWFLLLVFRGC